MNTKGVVKVITSLDDHSAEVTYDEKLIDGTALQGVLRTAGFLSADGKCC